MENMRIMLCEDELLFATEMAQRLRHMGYEVTGIAARDESAFRLAEESKPDFALMDVRLGGGMNGTQVAEILDKKYNIPSLYITAYSDEATLQQAGATNT